MILQTHSISNPKWINLEMHWREKQGTQELHHIYRPLLNTRNGNIYNDDKIAFITKKMFLLLVGRPLHTAIKTIYHVCLPISIPYEFYQAVKQAVKKERLNQKAETPHMKEWIKAGIFASAKSVADIVRTPFYGTALTLLTIAGAIFGVFGSEKIYDVRELAGKWEESLFWGNEYSLAILSPCFLYDQKREEYVDYWGDIQHPDTNYEGLSKKGIAEANLVRANFHFRRKHPFLPCSKPMPTGIPIDSQTYSTCGNFQSKTGLVNGYLNASTGRNGASVRLSLMP